MYNTAIYIHVYTYITLLTLGAHVQEGYGNLSVCVCRSVCLSGLFLGNGRLIHCSEGTCMNSFGKTL